MDAKGTANSCMPGVAIAEAREQFEHVVKGYPAMVLGIACFGSTMMASVLSGGTLVGLATCLGLYVAYIVFACVAGVHMAKASGTRPGTAVLYAVLSSFLPLMPFVYMVGVMGRLSKKAREYGVKPGVLGFTDFEKAEVERGFAAMEKRWQETMRQKLQVDDWADPSRWDEVHSAPPVNF